MNIRIVENEGTIEEAVKCIYKAMSDKKKTEVTLQFLCTTDFIHVQFLEYLAKYLGIKKAKRATHVKVDIFIEQKD